MWGGLWGNYRSHTLVVFHLNTPPPYKPMKTFIHPHIHATPSHVFPSKNPPILFHVASYINNLPMYIIQVIHLITIPLVLFVASFVNITTLPIDHANDLHMLSNPQLIFFWIRTIRIFGCASNLTRN